MHEKDCRMKLIIDYIFFHSNVAITTNEKRESYVHKCNLLLIIVKCICPSQANGLTLLIQWKYETIYT